MKAILLKKPGRPDSLKISEMADPQPGDGEVLVRLSYSGINYAEILSRKGLYGWAVKRPYILGMEGAGTIEAVGKGVSTERTGETVMVGTQFGCYADRIAVPANQAIPAVPGYDMSENAAFLVNYMTAWVSLFTLAKLQPGEKVLITAAAGGVGTAAVQLALKQGCQVFGMAGSPHKISFLESLGATAINYREAHWFDRLREKSGGVNVILEMVGGDIYYQSLKLLNPLGRLVIAGFASMNLKKWNPLSWWKTWREMPRVNIMDLAHRSGSVMATHLGYLLKDPDRMLAIYRQLQHFVVLNNIRPVIDQTFPLASVADAHRRIESRRSIGKVLLEISPNKHAKISG